MDNLGEGLPHYCSLSLPAGGVFVLHALGDRLHRFYGIDLSEQFPYSVGSPAGPEQSMKNIYEVIRQKELDLEQLKKEVQALRLVAPMLEDEPPAEVQRVPLPVPSATEVQAKPVAAAPPARPVWP